MSGPFFVAKIQKGIELLKIKKDISVILTDNNQIKKLNQTYRQQNRPTDVLSFESDDPNLLGDIFISIEVVKKQAKVLKCSMRDRILFLTVHGILHLKGFDHQTEAEWKKMRKWEGKLAALLKIPQQATLALDYTDY